VSATSTFSRALNSGKMFVIWNEREMPSRLIRCGASPVTSRPSNTTVPLVGCIRPESRL